MENDLIIRIQKESQEIESLFPDLDIKIMKNNIILQGHLQINNVCRDEHIIDEFFIKIDISDKYPDELPNVVLLDSKVRSTYGHIYEDGTLCLGTPAEIMIKLGDEFSLLRFIDNYVIPYFVTYKYYVKYRIMPYGERSHGTEGKIEFYKEYFNVDSKDKLIKILEYICNKDYRGHNLCPCGSQKKIRDCHGDFILEIKRLNIKEQLEKDLREIRGY